MKLIKVKTILTSGLSYILVGNFLSKFVALLSSVLIVRLVDKAEYAYLSYANNLYGYVGLFMGLGLANAMVVTCTPDVSLGKQRSYWHKAMLFGGMLELITAFVLCVVTQVVQIPFPEARKYMWLLFLYPMISYLFSAMQAFVRVKRNNRLYAILGALQTVVECSLSVVLVLLIGTVGVVWARYLTVFVVIFIALRYILRVNSGVLCEKLSSSEVRAFFSTAVAIMFANMFSNIIPINEAFIINNMIKDEIITANFKVAGIIPSVLTIFTSAIMVYYYPIIAANKHTPQIKYKIIKIAAINGVAVVALTSIGMLLTPFGITLIYGQKYADAVGLSYPLWIMRAVHAILVIVPLNVLPAIGKSKYNAIVSIGTCVIHVVLDYLFIGMWGVHGAACATIIAYILSGIFLWIYIIRVCPVKKEKPTKSYN